MKLLKLLILLLPLLATGCFDSNLDDCPPKENTTIFFSLKDKADNDVFSETVDNVELFIYDAAGKLVRRCNIPKSELKSFAGKRLLLEPGTYTIVAWANNSEAHSEFFTNEKKSYLDRANNYLLTAIEANGVITNGDPVYYAPKATATPLTVIVPEKGNVETIAEMRHAHVKLEITIEGYQYVANVTDGPPTVEVTGLTSRYDFAMKAHGDTVSYIQTAQNIDPNKNIFNVAFNIPIFDKNTTTEIRITNHEGKLVTLPISLKEILGDKINIEELWHLPIKIVLSEKNGLIQVAVTVDLPGWDEGIVNPNI